MPSFGKPNATGRSSGIHSGRIGKLKRPPKGEPWIWLTRELLTSDAWGHRGTNCARLIDALLIEHMNHAGTENGNLKSTHEQLTAYGLTPCKSREAIEEAEFLGLIEFQRGGRWAGTNQPSRFRLTFYADREFCPATDDWKRVTQEKILVWKRDRSARRQARRQKRNPASTSRGTVPL